MFQKATTKQLLTIWNYEQELCSPKVYKLVAKELLKRGELRFSKYRSASTLQLWVILQNEDLIQIESLLGAYLELIKRNEIKKYIEGLIKELFGTINSAENTTLFSVKELTTLCYKYGLNAIFEYKGEKNCAFIDFLNFMLINKLMKLASINEDQHIKSVG